MTSKIRRELENKENWRKWAGKIPAIKFPSNWYVRMLPPFAEAIVRFRVYTDSQRCDEISVF